MRMNKSVAALTLDKNVVNKLMQSSISKVKVMELDF